MRIKELILWYNGIEQHPKKYRSYKPYNNSEYIRCGKGRQVLKYVITGKRYGLNKQKIRLRGYNNEAVFYLGYTTNGEHIEIKTWLHEEKKKSKTKNIFIKKLGFCYLEDEDGWLRTEETIYKILFLKIYLYKFKDKSFKKIRINPIKSKKKWTKPFATDVYIEWDEWVNEYNKNKYLVPVNYKIPESFLA